MHALKDRAGPRLALVIAALSGALLMAAVIGFKGEARPPAKPKATAASLKGASCAHPYRVHWLVPGVIIPSTERGEKTPGEMTGDTRFIKASAAYLGPPASNALGMSHFATSWKPAIGGLKVCKVRITFNYRKPFVSHQWHPHPVKFPQPVESHDIITSLVITAAR